MGIVASLPPGLKMVVSSEAYLTNSRCMNKGMDRSKGVLSAANGGVIVTGVGLQSSVFLA